MKFPEQSIYSNKFYPKFSSVLIFELTSLIGRFFFSIYPPRQKGTQYLNLGCGRSFYKNWVNADFFDLSSLFDNKTRKLDWMLDMRYPLKCPDNYWDGVYSEHAIEHLYSQDVVRLMKEIFRTLKPGSWLRIVVPDLSRYVDFYIGKNKTKMFEDLWKNKGEAIWALCYCWGHKSVWDYGLLREILTRTGFINVRKVDFQKGSDKSIIKDSKNRVWESMYIEAQKLLA